MQIEFHDLHTHLRQIAEAVTAANRKGSVEGQALQRDHSITDLESHGLFTDLP